MKYEVEIKVKTDDNKPITIRASGLCDRRDINFEIYKSILSLSYILIERSKKDENDRND